MLKQACKIIAVLVPLITSAIVFAQTGFQNKTYMGIDLQANQFNVTSHKEDGAVTSTKAFPDHSNGFSLFVGTRWEYIGLEFGATYLSHNSEPAALIAQYTKVGVQ